MIDKYSKRKLSSNIEKQKPRKKLKLKPIIQGTKPPSTSKRGDRSAILDSLPIESLDWHDVSLPHRLEDYEGFFGLEEVDGVEVLRQEGSEKVQFRVTGQKQRSDKDRAGEPTPDKSVVINGATDGSTTKSHVAEEDWEGFVDDDEHAEKQTDGIVNAVSNTTDEPRKKKNKNAIPFDEVKGLPFTTLSEELLDDDQNSSQDFTDFDTSAWNPLNLSHETLTSLARLKFSRPTPVQTATIPKTMRGRNVIGKAPTGSGKTLAYGIPIYEHYLDTLADGDPNDNNNNNNDDNGDDDDDDHPVTTQAIALIISPTRELAHQIRTHLNALCSSTSKSPRPTGTEPNRDRNSPSIVTVTGGLSIQKQRRLLKNAHVVVATPGRLWEVMSESEELVQRFKRSRFLVVDEADRLLSDGHFEEFSKILELLERTKLAVKEMVSEREEDDDGEGRKETRQVKMKMKRKREIQGQPQTLVFSATFSKDFHERLNSRKWRSRNTSSSEQPMTYLLDKLHFHDRPDFVDVNPVSQMAEGLKEGIVECGAMEKDLYLYTVILQHSSKRKLVFTNSISSVRRLVPFLQGLQLPTNALHSHMPQKARLRSIERFSAESATNAILVSTDVAARGLDIPGVDLIIHYHVPRTTDTYVHRSGRTARGSNVGASILICAPDEVAGVRRLLANLYRSAAATREPSNGVEKKSEKDSHVLRQLDVDRKVVSQLKPRVALAKQLADTKVAQEKVNNERSLFQEAAEDLGAEYEDDEDFQLKGRGKGGRGSARKKAEVDARKLTKREIQALRAELKQHLAQRVNLGVSERYITNGTLDINSLLNEKDGGKFLGTVEGLDFG